ERRVVVQFLLLCQIIECPGTGGLARDGLAKTLAGFVCDERLEVGETEVTLDVAHPRLAARAELHALERAAAGLGRDRNDAVAGARTVQRRRRRALHDLY